MSLKKKIILISFATPDLKKSIKRFYSQALESNYYDEVKVITPKNLSDINKNKIDVYLKKKKKRGYCYWYWKPLIIKETLDKVNDEDIIHYLDIGFHIKKNKHEKFYQYINFLKNNKFSLLAFQYFPIKNYNYKNIIYPEREEYKYTKLDLLDYFNVAQDRTITHTPQFSAGNIFFKKSKFSKVFLQNWIDVFEKRFDLVDDTESTKKNFDNFIEHRHDQSIFSILCKKNYIKAYSAYEFDWAKKLSQRTWDHIVDFPFQAKRDLEYNIIKKFLNRQKKTINRLKKKFL